MTDDKLHNTARVAENAQNQFTVQAERHEPKPVEGVLIVDLTASRQETRDAFIEDFTEGSGQFEELIGEVSDMGNIALTLIVHNGDGVRIVDRFESPKELAEALSEIDCAQSLTQISKAMDEVPENTDFIIVNGDTTDGDVTEDLVEKAQQLGIPVIPLLEHTTGESGTQPSHIEALKLMGEASGVAGGPFPFQTRMSMLDFVAVASAATQGPEVVEALKATGKIPQEVWDAIPEKSLESISEAAEVTAASREGGIGRILVEDIGEGVQLTITVGEPPNQPLSQHLSQPSSSSTAPVAANTGGDRKISRRGVLFGLGATALAAGAGYYLGKDGDPDPLQVFESASRDIFFETGSADLTLQGKQALNHIAAAIKADSKGQSIGCVAIQGHASNTGTSVANVTLSDARALAVSDYLQSLGVPANRLKTTGLGTAQPRGGTLQDDQRVELEATADPC